MANYTSAYTGAEIDSAVQKANHLVDYVYPVGSIYMSVNSTSPQTLFGGTWVELQGRFLIGRNSTYTAGSTGGEANHTLTIQEMPSHNHNLQKGDGTSWAAIGWPEDGNTLEHINNTWGSSGWPKVTGVGVGWTGGSGAHNNMPPYLAVYMWKRTA